MTLLTFVVCLSVADASVAADGVRVIEIAADDGDIEVTARATATVEVDGEARVERDGDTVAIRVGHESARVHIPEGLRLELGSRSGDVKLRGGFARIEVRTISGDVELRGNAEEAEVKTVSGEVEVHGEVERLGAATVSGEIRFSGKVTEADLGTTSGEIEGDVVPKELRAKTLSGDIELTGVLLREAALKLTSFSGDITLELLGEVGFSIEAKTSSGDVKLPSEAVERGGVQGGAARAKAVVGDGSASIKARTRSGDVVIRRSKGRH